MKLIIDIDEKTYNTIKNSTFFISGGRGSVRTLEYNVFKAIFSDGKPLPKGHWTYICNSEVNGLKVVECSECGKRTYGSGNYCPNCGAKMFEPQESEE